MKRLVDGNEVEFSDEDIRVSRLEDRWLVHTNSGTFSAVAVRSKNAVLVSYKGRMFRVEPYSAAAKPAALQSGEIRAPMPGLIVKVNVKLGQRLAKGAPLFVLEAMKTQQTLASPFEATVEELRIIEGVSVPEGQLLAILKSAADN